MNYDGYEKDLYSVYESEVLGETMFGLIARCTLSAERRHKWQALTQLESQTKQRYLDYVADKPAFRDKPEPSKLMGIIYAMVFLVLPWRMAMKMLRDGTAPFMEVFKRLVEYAAPEDLPFFGYVVAHEEAIKAFAELELVGECDLSLQPVTELLSNPRPGAS